MSDVKSILIAGLGGQGAILISRIMTNGLIKAGYDIKQSESHGMAQRGGSVTTQVRYGSKVYGPVFGKGQADVMIALEKMEAVRCAGYLKPDGIAIINDYKQESATTASGMEEYPEGCVEAMQEQFKTVVIDAMDIAEKLGNSKCMNVVMFGATSGIIDADEIDWETVIADTVPEKHKDINIKAFKAGRDAAAPQL